MTSAPELKAQIEAERAGLPFLVFRDGEDAQRIVTIEEGASELWVGRGDSADLRLEVAPRLADQELIVGTRYWEGAVTVTGVAAGRPVSGQGYVELVGYGE